MHAAVVKNTFGSENVKKTEGPGALFEVQILKKCTPLWRNVHFEVKMYKTRQFRTTFQTSAAPILHATRAKVRRNKIHPRQMLEKSRNAVFFATMTRVSGAESGGQRRNDTLHAAMSNK